MPIVPFAKAQRTVLPGVIFEGFVLLDSQSRHLLQDLLGAEVLQAVDLQIRNPYLLHHMNVLRHFLRSERVRKRLEG